MRCILGMERMMSDLNRRAAEAMGWETSEDVAHVWLGSTHYDIHGRADVFTNLPHEKDKYFDPCNRIEHAWMLVEWATKEGYQNITIEKQDDGRWWCAFIKDDNSLSTWYCHENNTAPLAITRAFLEAVGDGE